MLSFPHACISTFNKQPCRFTIFASHQITKGFSSIWEPANKVAESNLRQNKMEQTNRMR